MIIRATVAMATKADQMPSPDEGLLKPLPPHRRRATSNVGRRGQRAKRRGPGNKRRGQEEKRRGQEGVTVNRIE